MLSRTWKDVFNAILKYAQQASVELKGKEKLVSSCVPLSCFLKSMSSFMGVPLNHKRRMSFGDLCVLMLFYPCYKIGMLTCVYLCTLNEL